MGRLLPGRGGFSFMVKTVEKLVTHYMLDPNTLVLVVSAFDSDLSNYHGLELAERLNIED
jgi:hypothetical protein